MNRQILVFLITLISTAHSCNAVDLYVSPTGDDSGSGTFEMPLRTIFAAQQRVRELPTRGREVTDVYLRGGTYYLDEALRFDARDSGSKSGPVVYKAYQDEKVVISGGVRLTPVWESLNNGIVRTKVPAGLEFDQLFVNGERQVLARFPNFDSKASPYHGASAEAFSNARASRWKDPKGGYIHAMHKHHWGGYHYRITGKDLKGQVLFEGGWQNNRQMGMHAKHRMVENIFEELDAPGEWYLDRTEDFLFFIAPPTIDLSKARFEATRLRKLISFHGTREDPVQNVSFAGVIFRHAKRTFMETREPLLRSDWTIYRGGAVYFENAEDCSVSNCEFDQLGGNGIFVSRYNRRIEITGCHLHHCGASGICFVGHPDTVRSPKFEYRETFDYEEIDKEAGPQGTDFPSQCVVDDCLIHNMSMVEKQATGVQISMSNRITVSHCSIYDMGRAGINISEGTFGGHVIEFCDVFNTVRETGDHGSFNSWGRDRFWHLRNAPPEELPALSKLDTEPTIIRNSRWRCDRGWDVDLDDGSSHYEIYNNLFLRGGLKLREGFYRKVYNNIAINNTLHPHVWYDNSMDIVTGNIWMDAYRPAGGMPSGKWGARVDGNLFTKVQDKEKFRQHQCDLDSLVGDPMFIDPAVGDFRVASGSPALKMGFKNFPMDRFGVRSEKLKAIAQQPELPVPNTVRSEGTTQPMRGPTEFSSTEFIWMGMLLRPITADNFSAYGVNASDGGVYVHSIPEGVNSPLKGNDVIQKINGLAVRDIASLQERLITVGREPFRLGVVRDQRFRELQMQGHSHVVVEHADDAGSFMNLKVVRTGDYKVSARPRTANRPVEDLIDRDLASNYGPVFGNGIHSGSYKLDLGAAHAISGITTWSYGLGHRGTQNFTLYGSDSQSDPGWQVSKYRAIGSILAVGQAGRYTGTSLRASEASHLGRFRWVLWRVAPVTDVAGGENTAFQEFGIEIDDGKQ